MSTSAETKNCVPNTNYSETDNYRLTRSNYDKRVMALYVFDENQEKIYDPKTHMKGIIYEERTQYDLLMLKQFK